MFDRPNDYGIADKDLIRFQPPPWKFGVGPQSAFAQDRNGL
jgi:hypothetical protein